MEAIGRLIENRVKELGMAKAEFARRINTSPQNVNDLFKRKSIDTEFLTEISKVLDFNFFTLLGDENAEPKLEAVSENKVKEINNKTGSNLSITINLDGTEENLKKWFKIMEDINHLISTY